MIGGGHGEPASSMPAASRATSSTVSVEEPPPPAARKWSWPELMRHTFGVDVLACARCGGRMRVVATIEDPVVIRGFSTTSGSRPRRRHPGRRRPTCSTGAEPVCRCPRRRPGVSTRRCLAPDHLTTAQSGSRRRLRPPEDPCDHPAHRLSATSLRSRRNSANVRDGDSLLVTEQAKLCERPGWGRSVSLRGKGPSSRISALALPAPRHCTRPATSPRSPHVSDTWSPRARRTLPVRRAETGGGPLPWRHSRARSRPSQSDGSAVPRGWRRRAARA